MEYKKNICDKLALGYGSKYQLLRMLGWHRNEFNTAIGAACGVDSDINWFDFKFNGPEDKELVNFEFYPKLQNEWENYWTSGVGGLNWDAVGISKDGTYILLEAKANLDEFVSKPKGSDKSIEKNDIIIHNILKKYNINKTAKDWDKNSYQLANRIVALDFLLSKGIKAKLVYVLFANGYEFNTSNFKSVSLKEWKNKFDEEIVSLGIKGSKLDDFINISLIDCNKK